MEVPQESLELDGWTSRKFSVGWKYLNSNSPFVFFYIIGETTNNLCALLSLDEGWQTNALNVTVQTVLWVYDGL